MSFGLPRQSLVVIVSLLSASIGWVIRIGRISLVICMCLLRRIDTVDHLHRSMLSSSLDSYHPSASNPVPPSSTSYAVSQPEVFSSPSASLLTPLASIFILLEPRIASSLNLESPPPWASNPAILQYITPSQYLSKTPAADWITGRSH